MTGVDDGFFEFIAKKARENFDNNHNHVPLFIIEFNEPTTFPGTKHPPTDIAIMPCFWETESDRDYMSYMVKAVAQTGKVKRIAFIHEMWFVGAASEIDCMPSEHPDRISVLWLVFEEQNGARRVGYWPIENADTKRAKLLEFKDLTKTATGWGGRFANFFGERKMQS